MSSAPAWRLVRRLSSICSEAAAEAASEVPSRALREHLIDAGAAVADGSGRVLACSSLHQLGTFGSVARTVAGELAFQLDPGEAVLLNDPYRGGSRVLDFHLVSPLEAGDPAGPWLVAVRTTAADLGGDCFGGFNPGAKEVWAEGARITPLRVFDGEGRAVRDALACVLLNSRTPRLLRAQLDGAARALSGCGPAVRDALADSGIAPADASGALREAVAEGASRLVGFRLDRSTATAEVPISRSPDGALVRLMARAEGGRIELDLSRSDAAGPGYANARRGTTVSAALAGALAAGAPLPAVNEGLLDAVHVITAPGTVVDAPYPLATGCSTLTVAPAVAHAARSALHGEVPPRPPATSVLGEDGRLAPELAERLRDDEASAAGGTQR